MSKAANGSDRSSIVATMASFVVAAALCLIAGCDNEKKPAQPKPADVPPETPPAASKEVAVKREDWSFEVDPASGMLRRLKQKEHVWQSAAAQFRIIDEMDAKRTFLYKVTSQFASDATPGSTTYRISGDELKGSIRYAPAGDYLAVTLEVAYQGKKDFGATLSWTLPLSLQGTQLFVTAEANHHSFDQMKEPLDLSYPFMAFPMLTAYAEGKGGVSIVRDAKERITMQKFNVQKDGRVTLDAKNLWMKPGQPVRLTYFIAFHGADWRCGLRWFRDRYKDWLEVKLPKSIEFDGPMTLWRPIPDDELKDLADQNLTWWEIHGTYEYQGNYVTDHEPYRWAISDRLKNLQDAGKPGLDPKELGEPDQTYDQVRDFISRLHKVKAKGLMYWNQNEIWRAAAEPFADSIVIDEKGERLKDYMLTYIMAVDPPNSYTRHVLEQLDKLMATFPDMDGIFNDQVCYFLTDYAHQDGISMVNGKPINNTRFGYIAMGPKVIEKLHAKNLILWGNGCYTIDVSRFYDGIMAEGTSTGMERSRYHGLLGKPVCLLGSPPPEDIINGWEVILKRSLISGVQPSVVRKSPYPPYPDMDKWHKIQRPQILAMNRGYQPLFQQLRGKHWVLTENAIRTSEGLEGNIFVDPKGRGLVTLVAMKSPLGGGDLTNQKVDVRFEDAADYRGAYLMSPAFPGLQKLHQSLKDGRYQVDIPLHRSASMVVFEKEGAFLSLDAASAITSSREAEVKVVLDNFTANKLEGVLTVETAGGKQEVPCKAAAGKSDEVAVKLTVAPEGENKTAVPVHLSFTSDGQTIKAESAVLLRGAQ